MIDNIYPGITGLNLKIDCQMNCSQVVSEFTVDGKQNSTPSTVSPQQPREAPCSFCREHLGKVTELRKREILLELRNEELKEQVDRLKRECEELINAKVVTMSEYQLQQEMQDCWNREDLQAELFEAKIIIELLLTSKGLPNHPQIKEMDDESLRQKYSDLLLDNLRLQEKLMVKDRIIEERVFFPIYHYDQRVTTLRRAMVHWYKKAEEECSRMRKRCRDMKQGLGEEMENMRQVMNQELESYRSQLKCIISEDSLIKKRPKEEKAEKKARVGRDNPSKPELKRLR